MPDLKVVVRHRVGVGDINRTALTFPIPENIDPGNVDSFSAAMVEHTAAVHQEEHFGQPERALVEALRRQVLTGILNEALDGPGRRLAARALAILALDDRQLLQAHAGGRRVGRNGG
jgi:hypothetical protein